MRKKIGNFDTELEAAQARDEEAVEANANGAMFKLNFPSQSS